ncbi:hypothetical protein PV327_010128 [Microctonus hyperodae]|uniref:tRNA (guanine(9)-N(1))-methyltransferase n=1 Tax=Microctonus hyperodae TaxID=165561 RepID=A0AA39FR86_MICHY|nr:hypothetical protein PV327_010128 [Microctonus hyperodae]
MSESGDISGVDLISRKPNNDNNSNDTSTLSKRQLKKIKKKEKWLSKKTEKRIIDRRQKERLKTKEKRALARVNNIDLGPSRKSLKRRTMENSGCKITITVDMSFDDVMIDKDRAKLIKQILRCYTLNRRAIEPVQFSLSNFNGKSKQEMEKHNGYLHWDVKFFTESYSDIYKSKKIIYLTSESDNVIDSLDEECVYVIGGLVDHNCQKGLCYKTAVKAGITHARLPLDKFLKMKARKVLTVDHVFEILLRITEKRTWQQAFMEVLPMRKKAKPVSPEHEMDNEGTKSLFTHITSN